MRDRALAALMLMAVLSACATMVPPYTQPQASVSEAWPMGPAYPERGAEPAAEAVADIPWQRFLATGG